MDIFFILRKYFKTLFIRLFQNKTLDIGIIGAYIGIIQYYVNF